ncbi:MAG: hypothetical protein AAGJ32_02115 [Pseudomonadota bacterium]
MTAVPVEGGVSGASIPWKKLSAWCTRNDRLLWAAWLILFGALSATWPRDMEIDVMHYHVHNGWALMNGRYDIDFAPANLHTFLNPYYQAGVWWLMERLPGPAVAFLFGIVHGLVFPTVYWFARNATRAIGMGERRFTCVLLGATAMLSEPVLIFLASMRNDALAATAFIAALALCVPPSGARASLGRFTLAGFIVGMAFGLKPTNALYVLSLAVFVSVIVVGHADRLKAWLATGTAGVAGILLTGGYWYGWLWMEFGNPFFPNMNGLFGSPYATESDFPGYVRVPGSLLEGLILPIRGSWDGILISWHTIVDFRLATLYVSALGLIAVLTYQRFAAADSEPGELAVPAPTIHRAVPALAFSMLALLFAWVFAFATHRYALAMYPIGPVLAVVLAWCIRPALFDGPRGLLVGMGGFVGLLLTTEYAVMHRQPWDSYTDPYIASQPPEGLEFENAFIMFGGRFPAEFTAPSFPESARFGHLPAPESWTGPVLSKYRPRMYDALQAHDGPIYFVTNTLTDLEATLPAVEAETGLESRADDCRKMKTTLNATRYAPDGTAFEIGATVCPLSRLRGATR